MNLRIIYIKNYIQIFATRSPKVLTALLRTARGFHFYLLSRPISCAKMAERYYRQLANT